MSAGVGNVVLPPPPKRLKLGAPVMPCVFGTLTPVSEQINRAVQIKVMQCTKEWNRVQIKVMKGTKEWNTSGRFKNCVPRIGCLHMRKASVSISHKEETAAIVVGCDR